MQWIISVISIAAIVEIGTVPYASTPTPTSDYVIVGYVTTGYTGTTSGTAGEYITAGYVTTGYVG